MSHFLTLVVTENMPTEDELQKVLLPWHEHECTGLTDYCVWVDGTDEAKAAWKTSKKIRYQSPDGCPLNGYEDEFYRDPTPEETKEHGPFFGTGGNGKVSYTSKDWGDGKGYRGKVREVPTGYVGKEMAVRKLYANFLSFAKDEFGYDPIPGKRGRVGNFTNPNSKWDWWQIGGCYSNRLIGPMGPCNTLRIHDVDNKAMLAVSVKDYEAMWTEAEAKYMEHPIIGLCFDDAVAKFHAGVMELCKVEGATQPLWERIQAIPVLAELQKSLKGCYFSGVEDVGSKAEHMAKAHVLSAFAVVMDGKWYENGEMGWWGMTSGESMSSDQWQKRVEGLLSEVPDTNYITVVDCHI